MSDNPNELSKENNHFLQILSLAFTNEGISQKFFNVF